MDGTIIFQDSDYKRTVVKVSDIASASALNTLCTALDSYSNAEIIGYTVIEHYSYDKQLVASSQNSAEHKAACYFTDLSDPNDRSYMSLQIPGPKFDSGVILEHLQKIGLRVIPAEGAAIAAALATVKGISSDKILFSRGHFRAAPTDAVE